MNNAVVLTLHVLIALSSLTLLISVLVVRRGDPAAPPMDAIPLTRPTDLEAAYLGGGPRRVAETAIATMQGDSRLVVGGPGIVAVRVPVAHNPVEQSVLQELATARSGWVLRLRQSVAASAAVRELGETLVRRGLLVPPARTRAWRMWGIVHGIVCFVGLPAVFIVSVISEVNSTSAFMESTSDDAFPPFAPSFTLLPTLFAGMALGFLSAALATWPRTRAGRRALRAFRDTARRPGASVSEMVAVYGVGGVPDPVLRRYLRAGGRVPAFGSTAGASSGGSSDSHFGHSCAGAASCGGGGSSSCGGGGGGGGGSCGGGGGS
ncbi:TIGR04222 domain-containing membrane protein [Streptomyces paludis]|uniref:TIGR04222 domain-containing membrane protein n=1 Tax=Streptomyces paludis TaxID=2282738 RepID=A0A345HW78_9ACTN|nr:TIGR04222 domain-containing membrane protein [Streptomyces paludis]AXG80952.1 TIGR04222 domain-containing membrane protein [Streptomyces paludis]